MRWSKTLLNTLREDPQEAEIQSHKLMLRAGLLRRLAGGLYTFTPMGLRALRKVERIVREEMDRAGAQEILMPALQPIDLWHKSGRSETMGDSMFKLRDRQGRNMVLGPTHEEVVTDYASREINSYRQLPCTLYQIQTKFRDEIRPRFGLMRAKEFIMKDAYSFDTTWDAADISYQAMYEAYARIFARCGLRVTIVEADTGDMGGSSSHEFMVPADSGEDSIVECGHCGYAANTERAERQVPDDPPPVEKRPLEWLDTPDVSTVAEVSQFLGTQPADLIKTLIYVADDKPIACLIPGDRELNEPKLKRALGARVLTPAEAGTVEKVTGAPVGFAGPMELKVAIYADNSLKNAQNRIAGGNRADTHVRNLSMTRDVGEVEFMDIVVCTSGDKCPRCASSLSLARGIEVGHVFKLGTKYTETFEARCLDSERQAQPLVMGCYGIGVTRTLQAVVEQNFDEDGICWPVSVAPCQVCISLLDPDDTECATIASQLERTLEEAGLDVIVDDRAERPGVKFKDADLIGFPYRIVVGARALQKGGVELRSRDKQTDELLPLEEAGSRIADLIRKANLKLTDSAHG